MAEAVEVVNEKRLEVALGVITQCRETLREDLTNPEQAEFAKELQAMADACDTLLGLWDEVAAQLGVDLWRFTSEQAAEIVDGLDQLGELDHLSELDKARVKSDLKKGA